MKWFWQKPPPTAPEVSARKAKTPKAEPLTGDDLAEALVVFHKGIHDFRRMVKPMWDRIPPVECPVTFGGYGFVEGRTEGMRVNDRLVVTEMDEDMDFTNVCVVINNVPSMVLEARRGELFLTIIAGRDYLEELFNSSAVRWTTPDQFLELPQSIQNVLQDILRCVLEIHRSRSNDVGVEAILRYDG